MKILQICPPHLSDVATLPWEIQKKHQKCHHTNLWIAKLFHLTEGLLHSFKRWRFSKQPVVGCHRWLWKEPVVMCGNWNVKQAMWQQVCRWPPSALIHASNFLRHWSVAQYTTLCWNSAHIATSRCRRPQHVRINTCAPPVACRRRSIRAMQVIGSTKQH